MNEQTNVGVSQVFTAKEISQRFGVKESTVLAWRDRGLAYLKVGPKVFFTESDLVDFLLRNRRTRKAVSDGPQD